MRPRPYERHRDTSKDAIDRSLGIFRSPRVRSDQQVGIVGERSHERDARRPWRVRVVGELTAQRQRRTTSDRHIDRAGVDRVLIEPIERTIPEVYILLREVLPVQRRIDGLPPLDVLTHVRRLRHHRVQRWGRE